MTDDSHPLVLSSDILSLSRDKKSSSWNFDDLRHENESNSSNDFFSVLKKNVAKHVYLNEEDEEEIPNKNYLSNKIIQQSTIRIDSSDLISRCKHFLPLLTDANKTLFSKIKSGENVRIELDSDQDNENDEQTIEMDLMFCPTIDTSSESDNTSDESDNNDQIKITTLQSIKKKNQVNIIEIQSTNNIQDDDNKSEDIVNK
ncbi:unnamed protein product [Rotaria sordida]|uniref:Uncharacterized protein n=1 Tax=Rotaria sordida TaxID=392033 RepID=A0A819II93_9BILA|nr:unnamed protein product [Rotaria sordida]CAF3916897.1 unnamed protein product [Rotaria sordida]